MNLTGREVDALEALCDTFVPSLPVDDDADPTLFRISARELGVSNRVANALDRIDRTKRDGFRLFLRLLESPLFVAAFLGTAKRFSRLSLEARERLLRRLAESSVPQLRSASQGARSLVMLHTYAANGTPESDALLSAIGYEPERNVRASAPRIPVTKPDDATIHCDVCVIGSGAGGSVVAAELAKSGQRVVVVEAGSTWSSDDFDQRELAGMQTLFREAGLAGTGDLSMSLLAGSSIGGGTTVNWQSCFRTPDDVRDEWASRSGCAFLAGDSFTKSLDAVWNRVSASTDESRINENNSAICRGAKSLGYRWSVIARNSRGCDLKQCGNCMFGCRVGGKHTASTTFLMDAIRSGAHVIAPFAARRLTTQGGAVTGVEGIYTDSDGARRPLTIAAPRVVLAAGALGTPVLLLRSGVNSPHLGAHLFLHPTVAVTGLYPTAIEAWSGPPQTVVCDEFSNLKGGYGYRIEAAPAHPGLMSVGIPWASARDHRREMQGVRRAAPFSVLTRDASSGRVRQTRKGESSFDYRLGEQEKELIRHGMSTVARMHEAAGAERILTLHSEVVAWDRSSGQSIDQFCRTVEEASVAPNRLPLFSAHQMGTCRMGSDRRSAVCDEHGAVFGLKGACVADGSLFPGSSGVNPMITIMALAHHGARGLHQQRV